MPTSKGSRLKKKLDKKVIYKLGAETVILRFNLATSGNPFYPSDDVTTATNMYGEPIDVDGEPIVDKVDKFKSYPATIVVDELKLDDEKTSMGGVSDKKRERLIGACSSSFGLQIGDKVVWPPLSNIEYEVDIISPSILQGIEVITEFKAVRDVRT